MALTWKEVPGLQPGIARRALAGLIEAGSIVVATTKVTIFCLSDLRVRICLRVFMLMIVTIQKANLCAWTNGMNQSAFKIYHTAGDAKK